MNACSKVGLFPKENGTFVPVLQLQHMYPNSNNDISEPKKVIIINKETSFPLRSDE